MVKQPDWRFHGGGRLPAVDGGPSDIPRSTWSPGPERFNTRHQPAVPVRMSDGTRLFVDITRPIDRRTGHAPSRPVPVILEQTPYRRVAYDQCPPEDAARFFVARGYIYVLAQVRGSGSSEGTIGFLDDREQLDGVELAQWAAALDGADGSVALNGDSYAGLNQLFTVARCGPGHPIRAIAPGYVGPDLLREPFTVGGLPTEVGVSFWTDWLASVAEGEARQRAEQAWVAGLAGDMAQGTGRAFDSAWWARRSAAETVRRVVANNVPVLLQTSGGDFYRDSLPRLYAMFQNTHGGHPLWQPMTSRQEVSARYQLSIGPSEETHSSGGQPIQPGGPRDVAALRWFEAWVTGRRSITADERTVRFVELHSVGWRGTDMWPPTLDYDHHHLDLGRATLRDAHSDPPSDAAPVEVRADQPLLCALEPFGEERSFAGPISLTLVVSTSSPDVLVAARLYLLDAEGRSKPLPIVGVQLASCRSLDRVRSWRDTGGEVIAPVLSMAGPDAIPSGVPIRLTVELKSVPFRVFPHEQLVLKIRSGIPEGEATIPPQTRIKLPDERAAALRAATFQVHSSTEHRSFLSLPADLNAT